MLKEGEEYIFTAGKEIETPDGKLYRILEGPDNVKYLLRAELYKNYEISEGKKIICRVDKINCKGEVFLEPRHPVYTPGKKYKFKVVSYELRSNESGSETMVIIVQDIFGNKIAVPSDRLTSEKYPPGSYIVLTIEKISKGRPILFKPVSVKGKFKGLKYGKIYDFRLERIAKGIEGDEVFIISDPYGRLHTIPLKYYNHYNIIPGQLFKGRIIKHSRKSSWKIEPLNPYYNIGDVLSLKIESVIPAANGNFFTLTLKDGFGFTHTVNSKNRPESNFLKCRVKSIRKGKPELLLL